MAEKTYAQLTLQNTVQDADLLATWRPAESGPLKRLQSSVFKAYVLADLGTAASEDIGTSGATVPLLNAANTWSAAQALASGSTAVTQSAGDNSTKLATTAYADSAVATAPPPGSIFGLTLSAAGGTATFGIAAGSATDSTNVATMPLASAYTKTTSAWAVGTGNGALDTGTIANNTWYHVWLIKRVDTGVMDVLVSLSATAPTMPGSYTLKRRIGAMRTDGSAQWRKFLQFDDLFLWDTPIIDINGVTIGTSAALQSLASAPSNLRVEVILMVTASNAGGGSYVRISAPDTADIDVAVGYGNLGGPAGISNAVEVRVMTNTSGQVRARAISASNTLYLSVNGWIDTRGQYG